MPSSVDLPAPLGPSSAHIRPAVMVRLTPARARLAPYRLASLETKSESNAHCRS